MIINSFLTYILVGNQLYAQIEQIGKNLDMKYQQTMKTLTDKTESKNQKLLSIIV